ncbi:LysR family transcriptional regulator [Janthinobacterium sp. FT14W]|uniref:LysR family transcriptional regulator n=1 Tax=Janthinobacterium sp. FT14W TaxID=2654253 RepID=UPI00126503DB|nr:LysR family transcriptional regulator [Janthinobacterium sp. FT14W]KAB8061215.1 LysR family transcriptional regulator [Janthinobacterium sp. FT14W]
MRYRLNDIEAFLLVIETGSFTAAALRLNISKSAISKRIGDLEQALGTQLLHRSTRGAVASDRGQQFYLRARDLVLQLEDAASSTVEDEGNLCGQVRIAAPMTFGRKYLAPMLFGLMQQHPNLNLVIDLDDQKVDVEGGGYDLALRITHSLKDMSLVARKLGLSRRVVVCSPDYAARHGTPRTLDELADHRCIGYAYVHSGQLWQFEPASKDSPARTALVTASQVFNNGEVMCDATIAGLGICLLPRFIAADALRDGRLVEVVLPHTPLPDSIYVLYPSRRFQSRKVRAVIDFLRFQFSLPLPWENQP